MDIIENLNNINREEKYFYWLIGNPADINSFYSSIGQFIENMNSQHTPYFFLDSSSLKPALESSEILNSIWKDKFESFFGKDDFLLTNKETMKEFLKNFIFLFDVENINLTLNDIEQGINLAINSFIKIFYKEYFIKRSKEAFISRLKGFVFKLVDWYKTKIYKELVAINFGKNKHAIEKIIFYDKVSTEQILFLSFLNNLAIDIIVIDTEGNCHIRETSIKELKIKLFLFDFKSPKRPLEKILATNTTVLSVSKEASEEITQEVYNESTGIYKAGMFVNHEINPLLLKVDYAELNVILKSEIKSRKGFRTLKDSIDAPLIFVKVNGVISEDVSKNTEEFKKYYNEMPMVFSDITEASLREISLCFLSNDIDIKRILDNFDSATGKRIHKSYTTVCNFENNCWNTDNPNINKRKISKLVDSALKYLLTNKEYVYLIKKSDMPFTAPKFILIDNFVKENDNEFLSSDFKIIISAFSYFSFLMGFDVVLFSFTADVIIENYIKSSFYQKITLEDIYPYEKAEELELKIKNYVPEPITEKLSFVEKVLNFLADN